MTTDELNAMEQPINDYGVADQADDMLRLIAIARAAIALGDDPMFDESMYRDDNEHGTKDACMYCRNPTFGKKNHINHADDCVYAAFVKALAG